MGGVKDSQEENVSYIRKIRKPLVEKKRRERMNKSISLLKSLIANTIQQNTAPMTRVDKADILELTVLHLTQLQQQQQQQQQQQSVTMATETAAFSAGYKACAREAVTYLANNKITSDSVVGSLSNHLQNEFSRTADDRDQQTMHFTGILVAITRTHKTTVFLLPSDKMIHLICHYLS